MTGSCGTGGKPASVGDDVERALQRALDEVDAEIWTRPARLRAVLSDLCPCQGLYIAALVQAAEASAVAGLAAKRASGATELSLGEIRQKVRRLSSSTGLSDGPAEWALLTWSKVLGLRPVAARRAPQSVSADPAAGLSTTGTLVLATGPAGSHSRRPRRWGLSRAWIVAFPLAIVIACGWGVYVYESRRGASNQPPSPSLDPRPAAVLESATLQPLPEGFLAPSALARLITVYVGQRELETGIRQVMVLDIRAIKANGAVASFLYVLNEGGRRRDNVGTVSLADGSVTIPDLGSARLGVDRGGRLTFMDIGLAAGPSSHWRLTAQAGAQIP